ncbi:hypothetical protein RJ639_013343 [Escallonia herrerae]|uniref:U-box domain-containing protein n=1 Tax=Escallonia herrerae TaxID=1293975 RepID=A0AA88VKJ7_9ASTE|nr:hypothetical protein RJ639_013343 [Escallonia herrerae]
MKDPVTLSTGITYDRQSIEKWISSAESSTCPVSKQALSDSELTPNHTLRRLIQSWCTLNASYGVDRIPTPKPPISKTQIVKLLKDSKSPQFKLKILERLKSIALENDTNKRCMEAAGAADYLASLLTNRNENESLEAEEGNRASDAAISILYHLKLSKTSLKSLIAKKDEFISSLMRVMQGGNYESRTYAIMLLRSAMEVAEPIQLITLKPVEAGAVFALIDILLETTEKRVCELVLMVLDRLCQCAEGRAELLKHGAGLAVVSKKILTLSQVVSERAVRVLLSVSKFAANNPSVVQEMLQLGVVAKLCLVLQVDCGSKTKEKAREILKLHARLPDPPQRVLAGPEQPPPKLDQVHFRQNCTGFTSYLQGATCNNGRIYKLSLSNFSLRGSISPYLANCTNLQALDLSSNYVTGPIPSDLQYLVNLAVLNLASKCLWRNPSAARHVSVSQRGSDDGKISQLIPSQAGGSDEGTREIQPEGGGSRE